MTVMMKCGHAANAKDGNGNPVCVICVEIDPGARTPADPPDLTGRKARCSYYRACKTERDSSPGLAFFGHRPDREFDDFYCGCRGWN